ncbi:MAG: hypothetical protein MIO93_14090 [ANME-2 cluster archaeon]|nr:hypothetical protein [ANME-2 cluster archaeon]
MAKPIPGEWDIDISLFIEDAQGYIIVNKTPGDKVDIVATIRNNEGSSQDIDVTIKVHSLNLETCFSRADFADLSEIAEHNEADGDEYTVSINLAPGESKQVVWRFEIPDTIIKTIYGVDGEVKVEDLACSIDRQFLSIVDNIEAIIVTNRFLLYDNYDNVEVRSLLWYLYEISDSHRWREKSCIVYYVDHHDNTLENWDQNVEYTNENTANQAANNIDDLIKERSDETDPDYLMIVGGDEIIPFSGVSTYRI